MIIASMCTIPVRKDTFQQVARRILHEQTRPVDRLHVWLNGYQQIDSDLPQDPRLEFHLEPSNPGPWVRYCAADLGKHDEVLATLDDDLEYPGDYIERGVDALFKYGAGSAISFGGIRWDCTMPTKDLSYGDGRKFFGLISPVERPQIMALPLGALSFFGTACLRGVTELRLKGFRTNDDMLIGWQMQRRGVPIICCPSVERWVGLTEDAGKGHALAVRDRRTRYRTFDQMLTILGFDPTAGQLTEFLAKPKRPLVLADVCPPIPGSSRCHKLLRQLCAEDASVHLLALAPATRMAEIQHYVNTPYEIHPVSIPEPSGRLDSLTPVRVWRNWRVARGGRKRWAARVKLAYALLSPTVLFRFQEDQLCPVELSAALEYPA